jgi:hypothetical protein
MSKDDLDSQLVAQLSKPAKTNEKIRAPKQEVVEKKNAPGRRPIYEDDVNLKSLSFKVPEDVKRRLDLYCTVYGKSHREVLVELLESLPEIKIQT